MSLYDDAILIYVDSLEIEDEPEKINEIMGVL